MKIRQSALARVAAVVAGSSLVLAACTGGAPPPASQAAGGPTSPGQSSGPIAPLQVQLISPFSGDAAFYGEGYRLGVDLALATVNNEVNGQRIEIVNVDDQCKPESAVTEVSKLLDTATVVLGPACSGAMLATQDALAGAKIPHIFLGYGAGITAKGDQYVFAASPSDKILAEQVIKWAKAELGVTEWGLIHDSSGYGAGGAKTFQAAADAAGVKVVNTASYNGGEREFSGLLLNLAASKPQAIHAIGYEVDLGLLVKQAGQAGIKIPIVGAPAFVNPEFVKAAGPAAEGQYFVTVMLPDDPDPEVAAFAKAVREKTGEDPKDVQAIGYTAGLMLIDALKRIDGPVTRESLTAALRRTDLASSPLGPVRIDATGARTGDGLAVIGQIKNGKATFLKRT